MARYRKFVVALVGAATAVVAANIDSRLTHIAAVVVAFAAAFGVYAVPNKGA